MALCGIVHIEGCDDPLPDNRVVKVARVGNFVSSGTLWNSDTVKEHIRTHKSKVKGTFDISRLNFQLYQNQFCLDINFMKKMY